MKQRNDNSKQKPKKKVKWQSAIGTVAMLLAGAACGYFMADWIVEAAEGASAQDAGKNLFSIVILFLEMYIALFLQLVIHEGGHLVFGLLTGYRYSSFRVGSLMLIKEEGKIKFKKFSLAGTGGQCLMVPPEMKDGKIPFVLYNLGGSVFNLLFSALFLFIYFIIPDVQYVSIFFVMAAIMGIAAALMNGIPLQMGTVNNDGYNALSLGKDEEALFSFWIQMKANEQIARGVRVKDMPEEWFEVPSAKGMKNSMIAVRGVFACNRLMDAHEFDKADALMKEILAMDTAIVDLHKGLLVCDRMYCALLGSPKEDEMDTLYDATQKKFMKSMKNYPSVLRTEYVYALLYEKDNEKAEKIKQRFEKCAKTYPYTSDIESERELIQIAEEHTQQ
ncbi:MAG: M50 family metallopeptidase [Lachnospiraceae bacterium]|nr:M50 family metallopeptidase [Lachnospiraceae bacterium]